MCYSEASAALACESGLCDVLRQIGSLEPTQLLVLAVLYDSLQLYGIRQRVTGLHDTSHRVGVVLKQDLRAVACLCTLSERKVLELCRNGLFRIVVTVVHDIRVGVNHQTDVLRRAELILQVRQQGLCCFEVILRRNDVERDILDRAVRGLFVLLFVLLVELLDVALAVLYQTVSYRKIRLSHILCAHAFLACIERKLCVQRVGLQQVLKQRVVFLLHVTDTNHFLPVQPIGLSLLQVRVLLCVLAAVVDSRDEVLHCVTTELTVLVVESATAANDLVRILADTEFAQLIDGHIHTDLLGLRTQRVVHHQHVPHLIADLCAHVFVKIRAAALNLVNLRQLVFCRFILRVVNLLTLDHTDILTTAVEETATGVQKVSEDKC